MFFDISLFLWYCMNKYAVLIHAVVARLCRVTTITWLPAKL
jgi:hypothetical protein